ncbi:hypothetical protein GDO81_008735 [Engystomops pustulosus]|uniref:Uncharacterized protein n=1 Tax=Engystomops pustulosus TaxID=76066 RepID=A0AAV7CJE4_ENGPU|nr:hypothetical protein GDO81_008735 [Engystomops pustulosus]
MTTGSSGGGCCSQLPYSQCDLRFVEIRIILPMNVLLDRIELSCVGSYEWGEWGLVVLYTVHCCEGKICEEAVMLNANAAIPLLLMNLLSKSYIPVSFQKSSFA